MRAKRYCPACHARFYRRIYLSIFCGAIVLIAASMVTAYQRNQPLLRSGPAVVGLLLILQYLLVIPHELGHAVAARFFGYSNIRILIGAGKPLFSFRLFGFDWLLNRVPAGGLTYAKPHPENNTRAKWILFVAGGLAVNGVFLLCARLLKDTQFYQNSHVNPSLALFINVFIWSNFIVIAENIVPLTFQAPFGPHATDGKLLFDAIFYWTRIPARTSDENIPRWSVWAARALKGLMVVFLCLCLPLLAGCALFVLFGSYQQGGPFAHIGFGGFLLLLTAILGQYIYRILFQPVATKRTKQRVPLAHEWVAIILKSRSSRETSGLVTSVQQQIRNGKYEEAAAKCEEYLSAFPGDLKLLVLQAVALSQADDYPALACIYDKLLEQITPKNVPAYSGVYAAKITLMMLHRKDTTEFTPEIEKLLALAISDALKASYLDQIACAYFHGNIKETIPVAEFCIQEALKLAPGSFTLKGTLGALLVEEGKLDEGEPLLRECHDRSPEHPDQGISGVYLALIAEQRGEYKLARKLARQSIILYSEDWLKRKVDALLARIEAKK
jgi:hypothetical protein